MVDQTSGAIRGDYRRVSRPILDLPRPYSVETRDEPKGSVLGSRRAYSIHISRLADASHPADRWPRPRGAQEPPQRWRCRCGRRCQGRPRHSCWMRRCSRAVPSRPARGSTPRADARTSSRWARPMAPIADGRVPPRRRGGPARHVLPGDGTACRRGRLRGDAERAARSPSARVSGPPRRRTSRCRRVASRSPAWPSGSPWKRPTCASRGGCAAAAHVDPTGRRLACFIDRLDLAPGTSDMLLRAAFAGKSSACPPARPAATRGRFG